ncbi:MAG TPA: hypothetical protein ENN55_01960, partial [Firmicutes bacterium]|nr:hypothetical protein [Bacillota bacterium]
MRYRRVKESVFTAAAFLLFLSGAVFLNGAETQSDPGVSLNSAAPLGLNASAEGMNVILYWAPYGKMDMIYDIYRSTEAQGEYLKINKEPVRENRYEDNQENSIIPLTSGITYYYKVEGVVQGASMGESEIVSAKPEGRLMPPYDLKAEAVFMDIN